MNVEQVQAANGKRVRFAVLYEYDLGPIRAERDIDRDGVVLSGNWRIMRGGVAVGSGRFRMFEPNREGGIRDIEIASHLRGMDYQARTEAAHNGLKQALWDLADGLSTEGQTVTLEELRAVPRVLRVAVQ